MQARIVKRDEKIINLSKKASLEIQNYITNDLQRKIA